MENLLMIGLIVFVFLLLLIFWKWVNKKIKILKDEIDKDKNRFLFP